MSASATLQIPSVEPAAGPSRYHYQAASVAYADATSAAVGRPSSVAVQPTSASPPSASSATRRQQRASHTVVSPTQQQYHHGQHSHIGAEPAQFTDVYSHPAAVAYAAAHPRRTIPKFGPYLLLQTLGEGEFGKVKLGLHCQWGEEVAVKLIRRGNVDSTVRMSKVEREIEVLRSLKHPNIVRLYDVIETDKYIGIILEYASGGELFDHILAHRYLRERDAAKLFSQLISGVWYIHQKKIVHRDLKLENLLLDRHRNVIITDFGFANRFEHRADDLMQTSCGSPCYAAPELVISEGLYVGSAVDIWSCGVILYAMLAGYLPFDDDPANPDGDNINLLYKYIVNTPLSFPDYISPEARDLLGMMLVPDPSRRSGLEQIMKHPWLSAYATPKDGIVALPGVPNAFGRSVEMLERMAMEQHQQKRLAYQRQMKAAALASAGPQPAPRSQSYYHTDAVAAVSPGGRSRSTQPEYLYDSSVDQSVYANASTMATPPQPAAASSSKKTYGSPSALGLDEDDPFAPPPGTAHTSHGVQLDVVVTNAPDTHSPSRSGKQPVTDSASGHKSTGSTGDRFRHTIQVEYDEQAAPRSARKSEERERRARERERSGSQAQPQTQVAHVLPQVSPVTQVNGQVTTKERRPSQASLHAKPLPPSPNTSFTEPPSSYRTSPSSRTSKPPGEPSATMTKSSKDSPSSKASHSPRSAAAAIDATPVANAAAGPGSPPDTPVTFAKEKERESGSRESTFPRHQRGRSSIDRLGRIFGGLGSSPNDVPAVASPTQVNGRAPSDGGNASAHSLLKNAHSSEEKEKEKEKEKESKSKQARRNTLTVMVEPFSRTIRNRNAKGRMASATGGETEPASAITKQNSTSSSTANGDGDHVNSGAKSAVEPPVSGSSFAATPGTSDVQEGRGLNGLQASTNKARKVMQWFRARSKVRESVGLAGAEGEEKEKAAATTPASAEYKKANAASTNNLQQPTSKGSDADTSTTLTPLQVVVTTPTTSTAPAAQHQTPAPAKQPHAPIQTQRSPSTATTTDTSLFATPSLARRFRDSVTVGASGRSSSKNNNAGPWGSLRIHHGAVDQTTITTRSPPEVIKLVREVLENMGVDIQVESEYKFRCVRAKRRKGSVVVGAPTSLGSVGLGNGPGNLTAVTMVGSAASNGVDKRGLPLPSPSTFSSATGGMLKGLWMRRQSSQVSAPALPSPSTVLPFEDEGAVVLEPLPMKETAYGDPSQDAGDEVRFSVELTRLDRLNDTFSLDIRRLKGNLRSYKFLYESIRQQANLQR